MCRRFDTILACDGQTDGQMDGRTDGIAAANTALAMQGLRRTVKTGNDVIYDAIIWVQDGNCKKMTRENFSIGAFYNITKNQDNPIKTVGLLTR